MEGISFMKAWKKLQRHHVGLYMQRCDTIVLRSRICVHPVGSPLENPGITSVFWSSEAPRESSFYH